MTSIAADVRMDAGKNQTGEQPIYLLHHVSGDAGLVSQVRQVKDTG